jgi:penicillin-binding protein 1A
LVYTGVGLGMAFLGATMRPYYLPNGHTIGPTTVYSSDGTLLAKLYAEYRVPVALQQVPSHTRTAILAAEDIRFYQHRGLDWRGIMRAAWVDVRARRIVQGGSTITQQLVRLELLNNRRTFFRKAHEAVLAVRVERAYSKEEILPGPFQECSCFPILRTP